MTEIETHLCVDTNHGLARLIVTYVGTLELVLAQQNLSETQQRALHLLLGRLMARRDADNYQVMPHFTGPGTDLVMFMIKCHWDITRRMMRPFERVPDFRLEWLTMPPLAGDLHPFQAPCPIAVYDLRAPPIADLALLHIAATNEERLVPLKPRVSLITRLPQGVVFSPTRPHTSSISSEDDVDKVTGDAKLYNARWLHHFHLPRRVFYWQSPDHFHSEIAEYWYHAATRYNDYVKLHREVNWWALFPRPPASP